MQVDGKNSLNVHQIDSRIRLVGSGSPKVDCGHYFATICKNGVEHRSGQLDFSGNDTGKGKALLEWHRMHCKRPECPICWRSWRAREVHASCRRLKAYVDLVWEKEKRHVRPVHVILSPPQQFWDLPYVKLRQMAYRVARKAGIDGGKLIYHPSRNRVDFSPHFHFVGYGWIYPVYESTGWIVKNKGIRRSVAGTISYELGHAGLVAGRKTVTWFGSINYHALKLPKEEKSPRLCPQCQGLMFKAVYIGSRELPEKVEGSQWLDDPDDWCIVNFRPHLREDWEV